MGAACCIAVRDKTIQHGSSGEIVHRNTRYSPTWSFRWDNRVGVAGEETSVGWCSDVACRNDTLDMKTPTDVSAHVSDGGSSVENYRIGTWNRSPLNQEDRKVSRASLSGHSIARNASLEVKRSVESPQVFDSACLKSLSLMHSTPSYPMLPQLAHGHLLPPSPTPSQWTQGSPLNQLNHHALVSHNSGQNSPSMNSISEGHGITAASYGSTRGSYGMSSDGWSAYAFSELVAASQKERWSFDSDSCSFNHDKLSRASGWNSGSMSMDLQACGICAKSVTEKSSWGSQKIMAGNELSVIAVLMCGHVYHAECLESITSEINKYDPACPVCTFGEKQTLKLTAKMLKAERDLKAKHSKKSRNRVMDTDAPFDFDNWNSSPNEGWNPKLGTSSSLKISSAKPFLRRHFSFGSRCKKSTSVSQNIKKKGLFWVKSSRE